MITGPLRRTQYWNVAIGTVRTGSTGHGESLTDFESYLAALEQVRNGAMFGTGVVQGLTVTAAAGAAGLTVSPGTAFDARGRVIALLEGGSAIVDPNVDPAAVLHVDTVLVPADGVRLATPAPGGDLLLTITWREIQPDTGIATAAELLHAPWLRLVAAAGFVDTGEQVVLAAVSVAADGAVTDLTGGPRQQASAATGNLALLAAQAVPGEQPGRTDVVQGLAAQLTGLAGGGLSFAVPAATGPRTAVRIDAAGNLAVGLPDTTRAARTAHIEGSEVHSGGGGGGFSFADRTIGKFVETPDDGQRFVWYAFGGRARLWSGRDLLSLDHDGRFWSGELRTAQLTIGMDAGQDASRIVHVEGGEVHSGGGGGGFSFADRSNPTFVDDPRRTGQRWVWYALDGVARLWSGRDVLSVAYVRPNPLGTSARTLVTINGNLQVTGSIAKGGGGFTIDHPLDPGGRKLSHSFVESPEMATLYSGTAVTGADGTAEIALPDYFAALNIEARVHLTTVDSLAGVTASTVREGGFTVRSAEPEVTVNWLVTGVRNDAWAQAHRIEVETDKDGAERGRLLHPDLAEPVG